MVWPLPLESLVAELQATPVLCISWCVTLRLVACKLLLHPIDMNEDIDGLIACTYVRMDGALALSLQPGSRAATRKRAMHT